MNDNERETRLQIVWEELNGGFALSNQDGRFLYEQLDQRDKTIAEMKHEIDRLSQLTLHELIADSSGINMKVGGASGKAFMAALIKFFEDNGGKNFLAMTLQKDEFKYQIEIRNLNGELSAAEKLDSVEKQNAIMLLALNSALFDIETGNAGVAKAVIHSVINKVKALPVSRQGETSNSVAASEQP